jgi:hypothetical protein
VSKLGKAVAHYLELRRALGFKLGRTETRLRQFVAFMEGKRTIRITTSLALEFATEARSWIPAQRPIASQRFGGSPATLRQPIR